MLEMAGEDRTADWIRRSISSIQYLDAAVARESGKKDDQVMREWDLPTAVTSCNV